MHRSKNFIGMIVIAVLLTACGGESEIGSTKTGIVNTDALKVRSEAAADAEVLSLLEQGAVIKIIAEENDFYQIVMEGQDDNESVTGYVKKEYVDPEH